MYESNGLPYPTARERYMDMLNQALDGVELTQDEKGFVEWIAGYDLYTVQGFCGIVRAVEKKKCTRRQADVHKSN